MKDDRTIGHIVAEDRTVVLFSDHELRHRRGPCVDRRPPRARGQHAPRDPRPLDEAGLGRRAREPLDRAAGRRPRHEQERPVRALRLQGGAAALDRPRRPARVLRRGRRPGAGRAQGDRAPRRAARRVAGVHRQRHVPGRLHPDGGRRRVRRPPRPGARPDRRDDGDVDGACSPSRPSAPSSAASSPRAPTRRSSPGSCTRSASRSTGTASSTAARAPASARPRRCGRGSRPPRPRRAASGSRSPSPRRR